VLLRWQLVLTLHRVGGEVMEVFRRFLEEHGD
jgi:hypothetical protein